MIYFLSGLLVGCLMTSALLYLALRFVKRKFEKDVALLKDERAERSKKSHNPK